MKHIVGTILKIVVGIYAVFAMLVGTFGIVSNVFGWADVHGCGCGNIKVRFRGPLAFLNEIYNKVYK